MDRIKPLYTATATAIGGRNGHTETSDHIVKADLSVPKELGGPGRPGTATPEHLFAAGYSACFGGALDYVAKQNKRDASGEDHHRGHHRPARWRRLRPGRQDDRCRRYRWPGRLEALVRQAHTDISVLACDARQRKSRFRGSGQIGSRPTPEGGSPQPQR